MVTSNLAPDTENRAIFTTSWDDGHPLDLKVAEILNKYECGGTFYVPCTNRQGPTVLTYGELRTLGAEFEIGGHTLDHCFLTTVNEAEVKRQVVTGKVRLEETLGQQIPGFAYPGGKHNRYIRAVVRNAGFVYARTVEYFWLQPGSDPYRMPTTIQLSPHSATAYFKNFAKRGHFRSRHAAFSKSLLRRDMLPKLTGLLDLVCESGGVFHLWGHSLDIEAHGHWTLLEDFLKRVAERIPAERRIDNLSTQRLFS
jgi:peptidoglycan/xylan/chitin deacetylase (PgdA/CDA1 family)